MLRSMMVLCTTVGFVGAAMTAVHAKPLGKADSDSASLEVSGQANNNKQRAKRAGGTKPSKSERIRHI